MCTFEEKCFTPLSASEYRLLDILCTLSIKNKTDISMEELARFAQSSEESIRRSLRKLEQAELVVTTRTKRNLGRLHKNKYELVSPSHKNVDENPAIHKNEVGVIHKNVGSTAGTSSTSSSGKDIVNKTTSYLFGAEAPMVIKKENIKVVNRWQGDDDDSVGGFGLFDNEAAQKVKGPKISKNNPQTRADRPHSEWTTVDVATEFVAKVRARMPVMPLQLSVKNIAGALARQRKNEDVNPLIELEIMEMFFEDPWIDNEGRKNPHWIIGRFLKAFSINFEQALKNLSMDARQTPAELADNSTPTEDFVYASDGRRFDNSMPGRASMERYEDKLRSSNAV
jgi:hypothetical protein